MSAHSAQISVYDKQTRVQLILDETGVPIIQGVMLSASSRLHSPVLASGEKHALVA